MTHWLGKVGRSSDDDKLGILHSVRRAETAAINGAHSGARRRRGDAGTHCGRRQRHCKVNNNANRNGGKG